MALPPIAHQQCYNSSGNTFLNSSNITEILAKKVIDRLWFPCAYRPGFHTERPDLNWFLEQWIPFDFGNQSLSEESRNLPVHSDLSGSRFGDWRSAPVDWKPYNPHIRDYQRRGPMKRSIFRCLNMQARLRQIELHDVFQAFEESLRTGSSVLSFTDHDFRDMSDDMDRINKMIKVASQQYKNVRYRHCTALEAARKALNLSKINPQVLVEIKTIKHDECRLIVESDKDLFGLQPFLAIKTIDGRYVWKNLDFDSVNRWSFTFDSQDQHLFDCEKIGVAFSYDSGEVIVKAYDVDSKSWASATYN